MFRRKNLEISSIAFAIFCCALTTFSSYKSIPVKFLSSEVHAIPVVPRPTNGSRTQSPFSLANFRIRETDASGNTGSRLICL